MTTKRLVADQHRVLGAVSIDYTFCGEPGTAKLHKYKLTGALLVPSKGGHDIWVMKVGADMVRRNDLQEVHVDRVTWTVDVKGKVTTELGSSHYAIMEPRPGREHPWKQVLECAV